MTLHDAECLLALGQGCPPETFLAAYNFVRDERKRLTKVIAEALENAPVKIRRGRMPAQVVSIGDRFGKWTVIGPVESSAGGRRAPCRCDCGFEAVRYLANLKGGCMRCAKGHDPERVTAVAFLYHNGLSLREIAGMIGVSSQAVQQTLQRNDVERRPPGSDKKEFDRVKALEMIKGGATYAETASAVGVSNQTIYALAKENGVDVVEIAKAKTDAKWIGKRNGRLEIIRLERAPGRLDAVCKCDCGKEHRVPMPNFSRTKSCGCLGAEYIEMVSSGAFVPCHGEKLIRAS